MSIVAAVLAVGYIIYGPVLVHVLSSGDNIQLRPILQFTLVAAACAIGLLVQCGVLLYTTYAGNVKTVPALIVLLVSEIIPGAILVRNSRNKSSVFNSLLGGIHASTGFANFVREGSRLVFLPSGHFPRWFNDQFSLFFCKSSHITPLWWRFVRRRVAVVISPATLHLTFYWVCVCVAGVPLFDLP